MEMESRVFISAVLGDVKYLLPNFKSNLLLMHPSTMKLLKFVKGCWLLLKSEKVCLILKCWPLTKIGPNQFVMPSFSVLDHYMKNSFEISRYYGEIDIADKIILNFEESNPFMDSKHFKDSIKKILGSFPLVEGLTMNALYMGNTCSFTINQIESNLNKNEKTTDKDIHNLCSYLSSLNVVTTETNELTNNSANEKLQVPVSSTNNSSSRKKSRNKSKKSMSRFFVVHQSTQVLIHCSQKEFQSSECICFDDSGGLDEQLEEIKVCFKKYLAKGQRSLLKEGQAMSDEPSLTRMDFKESLKNENPSSMVEFKIEVPNVKWSDIGGMHNVKNTIIEMVDWPLKHAEQFKKFHITPSKGVLLYGPPGCSKTMIAKALVSESHLNFISIKGPQLFSKYVGESEQCVSELFKRARSAAPCVIFFDEIDSLATVRGSTSGNSNVADRVLTQLLIEIDGVNVLKGVSIIAATNRPDMIDPSLLRPGRFDHMIYVPLPDALTRKEILDVKLQKMPLASDVDLCYLVDKTENFTGAEITDLCREAAMSVIKDDVTSLTSLVTMDHFHLALQSVLPRTTKETIEFYENYVLCALNFFAGGRYQKKVGNDNYIKVTPLSASNCIRQVSQAMSQHLLRKLVQYPSDQSITIIFDFAIFFWLFFFLTTFKILWKTSSCIFNFLRDVSSDILIGVISA
ncbi:ribosome biogenesis protein SPATA5-like [Uloborus diversus]|uniref:ribosome biogenesis protein SPATA5-like n=1 Tax=Uloborus diversus TaxID=327109 RepID=UPI00240A8778|nr:ribosome biogenesis protein SPATA5-like [Uloborus diversus]